MNGRRSRIPSAKAHAPSPKKTRRLNNSPVKIQTYPGPMLVMDPVLDAKHLLMNNGIDLSNLSDSQIVSFAQQNPAVQQKSIDIYRRNRSMNEERDLDLRKV